MELLTEQEVFDRGVSRILKQNAKCTTAKDEKTCAYHNKKDQRCVAGWVFLNPKAFDEIRNRFYSFQHDFDKVPTCLRRAMKLEGIPQNSTFSSLLRSMQDVHDHQDIDYWTEEFAKVAKRYELSTKVIDDYLEEQKEEE